MTLQLFIFIFFHSDNGGWVINSEIHINRPREQQQRKLTHRKNARFVNMFVYNLVINFFNFFISCLKRSAPYMHMIENYALYFFFRENALLCINIAKIKFYVFRHEFLGAFTPFIIWKIATTMICSLISQMSITCVITTFINVINKSKNHFIAERSILGLF